MKSIVLIIIALVVGFNSYAGLGVGKEQKTEPVNFYLVGDVNGQLAYMFETATKDLEKEPNTPINIYVNSPGGSVIDGLAIIDNLKRLKNPINYYVNGEACSMAAVIVASGKKGHRFATKDSLIMIHDVSGGVDGKYKDIKANIKFLDRVRNRTLALLALGTGKSFDIIEKDCTNDYFMSSREAIEYGLIDKIY